MIRHSSIFSVVLIVVAAFCGGVGAQTVTRPPAGGPPPAVSRRPEEPIRETGIAERQFIMRALEMEARKPAASKDAKLALAQIAEDFSRLQLVNNKMMSLAFKSSALDYRAIADATLEIEKRANRIKVNLPLPEDDSKGPNKIAEYKPVSDPAGMKASLLLLDERIQSFVGNPIFKNTSVVEVGEASRAKRDLSLIVDFSNRLAKDARRLSKVSTFPKSD